MDTLVTPTALTPGMATTAYGAGAIAIPGAVGNAFEAAHWAVASDQSHSLGTRIDAHFVRDSVERNSNVLAAQFASFQAQLSDIKCSIANSLQALEISRLKDEIARRDREELLKAVKPVPPPST